MPSLTHGDGNWLARCYHTGVGEIRRSKRTKQMSDFHASTLNAYEFGVDQQEQLIQESADNLATALMGLIDETPGFDIRGKDWEKFHNLLCGHLVDHAV